MKDNEYFGEWAPYGSDEDRKDAEIYLNLWKKFLLKKFPNGYEYLRDQLIDRPPGIPLESLSGRTVPSEYGTLAMKIVMKPPPQEDS